MKVCILMGSPRKEGNTTALLEPFIQELEKNGNEVSYIWLYDKKIEGCTSCRTCQNIWDSFGCPIDDDMQEVFDEVYKSDYIIFASPIYAWYCTAPLKAAMDRLVYGMNKYYGDEKGPSLWEGKKVAIATTSGYRPEKAADLFEQGIMRLCKHSKLEYCGMLAARNYGYNKPFMNEEVEKTAIEFANKLMNSNAKEVLS